jgi:protein-S-isoprenylcysteine O-methyltransferase Ste14
VLAFLPNVGWLFAIVLSTVPAYWLLVHPRAEYWRRRRGPRFRVLVPLWVTIWMLVGAVTWPWRHIVLYENPLSWLAAALFFAAGFWLYYHGRIRFSLGQLIGRPEVQGDGGEQRLVTTGIRARVRHPVYLGHLCELIAWSVGTGLAVIYGLTLFAMLTGALMIRMEDDELERRFGDSYRQYRASTPAIIPRFNSRNTGTRANGASQGLTAANGRE